MKVAPAPASDSTSSVPPWASAIERAMKSPRPAPGFEPPSWRTRPNFSKIRRCDSGGMPGPWSRTLTATTPSSSARGDLDLVAGDRVLDRVREQVPEQLAEPLAVALHRRERGRDARRHAHLVLPEGDDGGRLADELLDVHGVEGVRERARLDARRVEDVADQVGEPRGLALDQRRGTTRAAPGVSSRQRRFSVCAQPITEAIGRAQLVRDHRDEVGAQRRQAPQLLGGAPLGLVGADVLDRRGDLAGQRASASRPPRR